MNNFAEAFQKAEEVLVDNFTHITEAKIRVTSSSVSGKNLGNDSIYMNAVLRFDDGVKAHIRNIIPNELHDELDSEKALVGYILECLINHLILPQYFGKF